TTTPAVTGSGRRDRSAAPPVATRRHNPTSSPTDTRSGSPTRTAASTSSASPTRATSTGSDHDTKGHAGSPGWTGPWARRPSPAGGAPPPFDLSIVRVAHEVSVDARPEVSTI